MAPEGQERSTDTPGYRRRRRRRWWRRWSWRRAAAGVLVLALVGVILAVASRNRPPRQPYRTPAVEEALSRAGLIDRRQVPSLGTAPGLAVPGLRVAGEKLALPAPSPPAPAPPPRLRADEPPLVDTTSGPLPPAPVAPDAAPATASSLAAPPPPLPGLRGPRLPQPRAAAPPCRNRRPGPSRNRSWPLSPPRALSMRRSSR